MNMLLCVGQPINALAANFFLCDTFAMMIDATVIRARAYIQAGGSKQALADAAGLHRNTLLNVESMDWSPTFRTVRAIGQALDALERERAA